MPDFECIQFGVRDRVATITLDRPKAGNAMNLALTRELGQAAQICDRDPTIKTVLLTGKGRFFCVGGDLKAFSTFGDEADLRVKALADELHKAISIFARMSAPLVVAVNGPAAGAGFSLSLVGDYVVAAQSATFSMAYTAAGLSPDGSSTYFLPRLVGLRRAQELAFTNRTLDANDAMEWGLVTRVVTDEALLDEAAAICSRLAAGPADAQATVKKLLLCSLGNGLEEQMELEGRAISRAAVSIDGIEGVHAFTEKRKPLFG